MLLARAKALARKRKRKRKTGCNTGEGLRLHIHIQIYLLYIGMLEGYTLAKNVREDDRAIDRRDRDQIAEADDF